MVNIEICAQVFKGQEQTRVFAETSRGGDFSCTNGVQFKEVDEDDFIFNLKFQKKFNEMKK